MELYSLKCSSPLDDEYTEINLERLSLVCVKVDPLGRANTREGQAAMVQYTLASDFLSAICTTIALGVRV